MERFALVTGSSSGLGLEMTKSLLRQGYTVFGGSRTGTEIEHDHFYDVELDLSSEDSVEEFFETIREFTESLDLVINNAALCEMLPVGETSRESIEQQLSVNTIGPFLIFKGAESFIKPNETHFISILSTAALYGYPNVSAYSASKFGFLGVVESLKKEWKDYHVRFTNLFPGAVDTPLWDKMGSRLPRNKMLKISDFISVFDFVVSAPSTMQFPNFTFLHRDGFIE